MTVRGDNLPMSLHGAETCGMRSDKKGKLMIKCLRSLMGVT